MFTPTDLRWGVTDREKRARKALEPNGWYDVPSNDFFLPEKRAQPLSDKPIAVGAIVLGSLVLIIAAARPGLPAWATKGCLILAGVYLIIAGLIMARSAGKH